MTVVESDIDKTMNLLQFQRLCLIQAALVKLLDELDAVEYGDSWIVTAVKMLDNEIGIELWDIEHELKLDVTRPNPDPETTETPAEAEVPVGAA